MKVTKTASGKEKVVMSKSEWEAMGAKAGWMKEAQSKTTDAFVLSVFIGQLDRLKQRAVSMQPESQTQQLTAFGKKVMELSQRLPSPSMLPSNVPLGGGGGIVSELPGSEYDRDTQYSS